MPDFQEVPPPTPKQPPFGRRMDELATISDRLESVGNRLTTVLDRLRGAAPPLAPAQADVEPDLSHAAGSALGCLESRCRTLVYLTQALEDVAIELEELF